MIEYEQDAIVHSYITEYIRDEISSTDSFLESLEQYAKENAVPIVTPETASLIETLGHMIRPKHILEIGCAIGYSSILLSKTLADSGKVTTIEYNPDMVKIATENIQKANLSDTINVVEGDAKDLLSKLDGVYDYIFLDGPKGHYIHMLDDCIRLLRKGGILVADNVLYKGMIAEQSLVIRRKITIVKRLRKFITEINNRSDIKSTVIPIGDGVTVSVKL